MAGQPKPPNVPTPPRNKGLIRAYQPLVSLNKALLNPYFWGGYVARGGRLAGHEFTILPQVFQPLSKVSQFATKVATDCLNDLESIWKAPGNNTIHRIETKIRKNLPKRNEFWLPLFFPEGSVHSISGGINLYTP